MKHYSQEIKAPKNMKEGLQNFVQMIINEIEAENHHEALMKAVDLLNDLWTEDGPYSSVVVESAQEEVERLKDQHKREMGQLQRETDKLLGLAHHKGRKDKELEIRKVLGL